MPRKRCLHSSLKYKKNLLWRLSEALKPITGKGKYKALESDGVTLIIFILDSVSLPVFDTMTHLIARIGNRVIRGKELCRLHSRGGNFDADDGALHSVESALPSSVRIIILLDLLFDIQLHPRLIYFLLSFIFGGKKGALKYVLPH